MCVLEKASRDCIPSFTVDSFRDYIIPGFTEHVKELHTIARADYCSWRADGNMVSHRGHNCISSALTILDSALTS